MAISVRRANLSDTEWIIGQLKEFSEHYGGQYSLFAGDEYAKEAIIKTIIDHVVFVAECSSRGLVGLICGILTNHIYNPKIRVLTELFWWVDPKVRGSRASKKLIDEYVTCGKQQANWLTFGLMSNSPIKKTALEKRGFRQVETSFLLEV